MFVNSEAEFFSNEPELHSSAVDVAQRSAYVVQLSAHVVQLRGWLICPFRPKCQVTGCPGSVSLCVTDQRKTPASAKEFAKETPQLSKVFPPNK